MNAGELNPSYIVEMNHIVECGVGMLNITGPPIMDVYVQNTRLMTIANNHIAHNYGGIEINTTSNSLSNSLYSNITNNFIAYNSHGEALHVEGNLSLTLSVIYVCVHTIKHAATPQVTAHYASAHHW